MFCLVYPNLQQGQAFIPINLYPQNDSPITSIISNNTTALFNRPSDTVPQASENLLQVNLFQARLTAATWSTGFIPYAKHVDSSVHYYLKDSQYTIFFTSQDVVFISKRHSNDENATISLQLHFINANPDPLVEGVEIIPGMVNHLIGNDPRNWRTKSPTYSVLIYRQLYPGIDLIFRYQDTLKSEFVLTPGADPSQIRLAYAMEGSIGLREDGALMLQTALGQLIETAPTIFQLIDGQEIQLTGGYRLLANGQVGFDVEPYDSSYTLVIDPTLDYSTYVGGNAADEGLGIAVDKTGEVYIVGITDSIDFLSEPLLNRQDAKEDIFVMKFDPKSNTLIYTTYLGGSLIDQGAAIAIDESGGAYITGMTDSVDFPTTAGAFQTSSLGGSNAFVTKLDSQGNLIFSTYLGGSSFDEGLDIAVDKLGASFVTGTTASTDFPIISAMQFANAGGETDAFVAKLNEAGSDLVYATYLGGSGFDVSRSVAVDGLGAAYVTGTTESSDFPTSAPFQTNHKGGDFDAFVAKLDETGSTLEYSTFLGGNSSDEGVSIAVDASGFAYVTGTTDSTDFPTLSPLQMAFAGGFFDAFAVKLNQAGDGLIYATYLGGSGFDISRCIAVDKAGFAYITGATDSTDFPQKSPYQAGISGVFDVFVVKLNEVGSALDYATYIGGGASEEGMSIAVDDAGIAYVTGSTESDNFPTATPYQVTNSGGFSDVFFMKLGPAASTPQTSSESAEQPTSSSGEQPPSDGGGTPPDEGNPNSPNPEVPNPEVPNPEVPNPEVPNPEVPDPEVPDPEVPDPPKTP